MHGGNFLPTLYNSKYQNCCNGHADRKQECLASGSGGEDTLEPQYENVQETQLGGEPGEFVDEDQAPDEQKESAAEEFDGVKIFSEIFVERHELADAESGEQERDGQAGGVDGEQENSAANIVAGGSESEHGGEDGANAGSPAEGKCKPQHESAPRTRLRDRAAEMNVAVEPAGQGRTEKADDRERKKVQRAESGEERTMMSQGSNPKGDEDDAENNAGAGIQFDEQAKKMETKKKDERSGDGRERIAILFEENTYDAGGCSERDKDNGKAGDKGERGAQQAGARDFTLAELLHADTGEHGDVARNERQNARGQKRNQSGEKSSC